MARHSAIEVATGAAILLIAGGFLVYAVANTGQHIGAGAQAIGVVERGVQRDVSLTTDSSATISTDGLLGGKYLALATGGDEAMLKPGATITITQGSVNLEALLGKYIFGSTKDSTTKPAASQGDTGPK